MHPGSVLRPQNTAELADILGADSRPLAPTGSGSKGAIGLPVAAEVLDLSALEGVGPQALRIGELQTRAANGEVREVILALPATVDGQTTAHYLAERLEASGISVTMLARGVPVGGELDWLDDGTIAQALRARRPA